MAFGPSDRSEVIELVGFDDHEKSRNGEKECRKEANFSHSSNCQMYMYVYILHFVVEREDEQKEATIVADEMVVEEEEEEGGSEGGRGVGSEEGESTKTSEGSVGVEEGVVGVVRTLVGGEEEGKVGEGKVAKEPENEFMLDGFDFSTSKSYMYM